MNEIESDVSDPEALATIAAIMATRGIGWDGDLDSMRAGCGVTEI
jgi:hypothetical protein